MSKIKMHNFGKEINNNKKKIPLHSRKCQGPGVCEKIKKIK